MARPPSATQAWSGRGASVRGRPRVTTSPAGPGRTAGIGVRHWRSPSWMMISAEGKIPSPRTVARKSCSRASPFRTTKTVGRSSSDTGGRAGSCEETGNPPTPSRRTATTVARLKAATGSGRVRVKVVLRGFWLPADSGARDGARHFSRRRPLDSDQVVSPVKRIPFRRQGRIAPDERVRSQRQGKLPVPGVLVGVGRGERVLLGALDDREAKVDDVSRLEPGYSQEAPEPGRADLLRAEPGADLAG